MCDAQHCAMTVVFFFFNDTATTEIYTLSLHDALPISQGRDRGARGRGGAHFRARRPSGGLRLGDEGDRSEEHTSELQSQSNLVCRLLLAKKKIKARQLHERLSQLLRRAHVGAEVGSFA